MNKFKQFIKAGLKYLHLDVTRNMKYDRETEKVIKKVLKNNSCTIDVGCHKGEMLEQFIAASPKGKHFGFEPIPDFYNELNKKFNGPSCTIYPYALADKEGTAE